MASKLDLHLVVLGYVLRTHNIRLKYCEGAGSHRCNDLITLLNMVFSSYTALPALQKCNISLSLCYMSIRWWRWPVKRSRSIFSSRWFTRSLRAATCHIPSAREAFWSTLPPSCSKSKTAWPSPPVSNLLVLGLLLLFPQTLLCLKVTQAVNICHKRATLLNFCGFFLLCTSCTIFTINK